MKTISGFLLVVSAAACAGCASVTPPPTLASHPDHYYPGYQRVLVDGQERFCYSTGSGTERKATCLTQAQVLAAQVRKASSPDLVQRPVTPNLDSLQAGIQLQQSAATLPAYAGPR